MVASLNANSQIGPLNVPFLQLPERTIMHTLHPGLRLRALRERLNLTLRDVEEITARLSAKYQNDDYALNLSRLSDIETKRVVPNIFRIYSLSVVYGMDVKELLSWYGIQQENLLADMELTRSAPTRRPVSIPPSGSANVPIQLDPGFDMRRTANVGRFIQEWGVVPLARLSEMAEADEKYVYGYVGLEDFTMYPLLLPGSFVQVDESRRVLVETGWRSEYERPIYFFESRDSYICCWARMRGKEIILESHPLSPVASRTVRSLDLEIIGQVVGIAMRLGRSPVPEKKPQKLSP
ncbi:MAG: hypothetical protein AB7O65_00655 [Candidatus Korobacteraceae bacterium]